MSPYPVASESGQPFEYERVLRNLTRKLIPAGAREPQVDIVLCVLNENNGPLYGTPQAHLERGTHGK